MRSYYQEHKEEMKEYQRKYYQEHKEEMKERKKKRKIGKPYKKQGDFLKKKLEELDKNQSWLARELGVTRESISNYIKGVYFPRDESLRKELCRTLKIKYSDLEKILNED